MANKRSYSIADVRAAVQRVGPSVTAVAKELNCGRSTIYSYKRKYPEIQALFETGADEQVQGVRGPQYTDEQVLAAIEGSFGNKTAIANKLDCTRQTVDNRLAQSAKLRAAFNEERKRIVELAENKLVDLLERTDEDGKPTPHPQAVFFTLKTMGKDDGWTERHEMTGTMGIFTPQMAEQIEELGLDMGTVAAKFNQLIQLAALQKRRESVNEEVG